MLKQGLNQKLLQKLSPQQIQFIQLLQLSVGELENRLEDELAENPALEQDSEADKDAEDITGDDTEENWDEPEIDVSDYLSDEDNDGYYYSSDPNEKDEEIPYAGAQTLFTRLESQLNTNRFTEHEHKIAKHLIGMIEDDGYIRRPLKSIAYDLMFLSNVETNEEELEKVLKKVQYFDPPGIAARSLEECLSIQLERMGPHPKKELALKIVNKYLKELGNKHYDKLKNSLKIDTEELREAIELIRHLNPKPGESQQEVKTQYVSPDFMVTERNDELFVSLNSRNAPELSLSQSYKDTLQGFQKNGKDASKDQKKQVQFIKQKLDSAKWFIDAIKQRQNTLLSTMQTIVRLQPDFFRTGEMSKLKPMILKDIADRIDMDISTVSRVVSSKYVQTDYGIYSLKDFFSEGIITEDGTEVSNIEVKEKLRALVEQEDKNKPLTDDVLMEELKNAGYNIARRTVAKYREQLNIPVARLRKQL